MIDKKILEGQGMVANDPQKTGRWQADPESGIIAVEFAFLLPLFLMILVGIVEFGNMWYVEQALTNASREGARAAVLYIGNPTPDRGTWARQQAVAAVNSYLGQFLPKSEWTISNADIIITPQNPSNPSDLNGAELKVSVKASNYLLVLHKIIPALASTKVEAATTMRME
jgi:Flp pilus assembly protein TadG